MKRLAFVLLFAACGGSPKTTTAPTEGDHGGPAPAAWSDTLTPEQKAKFMEAVVVPKFKPMFQKFDAKGFAEFGCKTCHGEAVEKTHKFDMPNPEIFVLPEAEADFGTLLAKKPDWMKFMGGIEEDMAKTLGKPPYNPQAPDKSQFGCYGCHTHKPGGGEIN